MLVAPFAGSQAVAQTHNLTGTVVDAQGNPVAGAAVVIDGTTKGTSTGSDGSFALNGVMANQSLLVTFIGYEPQTVAIGSQTNMKVVLKEDNQTLDEVVVIGYGVQKKRDVTGSITSVKSDVFESRSVENAQQALQGKAPGVQVLSSSAAPGSSPSIRIRGFSSNNSGASEPLYVVDGLKVSDISYLDPSSIESMEILKDGASAAIYGVEAGNGVVLITTKKGKKGDGRIFYDFTYGITSLARKADLMNAEQYVAYQTAAGNSQSLSAWDGKTDTDWFDVLYGDNGSFQRHTAGVEMANDYGSVYASLSYMDNDGMYYGNKDWLKRVTFQLNGDYKVKKWLTFTTNNTVESSRSQNSGDGVSNLGNSNQFINPYGMDPLLPAFWDKDNLPAYMTELIAQQGDNMFMKNEKGDYVGIPFAAKDAVNPLTHYYSNTGEHKNFALRGASSLVFAPVEGLTVTSRVGYRLESTNYSFYGVPTYFAVSSRTKMEDAIGRKDHDEPLLHVGELRQLQQHVRQAHDQRDGRYVLPVRVEQLHFGFDQRPDRQQQQFPPLGLRFDRRDQRRGRQSRRNFQYQLLRPCRLYVRQPLQHHGQFPRRRFRPLQIVEGSPLGLFPLGVGRVDDLQRAVHARYRPQDHFVPEAPRFVRCQR